MKQRAYWLPSTLACVAFLVAASAAPALEQPPTKGLPGLWQGTLKAGIIDLRLILHVSGKGDKLECALDVPDQGAKGIKADEVESKDGKVRLEWKTLKAVFEGKLKEKDTALEGHWKQSGQSLPLTFRRTDKVPVVARPQHPKKPYPYKEEEVSFENKKAGVKFAGTLTLPRSDGPFPAVVLISGSGPQDRNETLFGHKPFLVLADYLTRRGIVVLRVDDRGVGGSTGSTSQATTPELADDVLAAVVYLKGRKEIDSARIGLLGHSEGGVIAPIVATQSKDVAFIVLLAGTGLPGEQILYLQGRALSKAVGASDEELARQRQIQETIFRVLREEKDNAKAKKLILERLDAIVAKLPKELQKQVKEVGPLPPGQLQWVLTPWFRFFLDYDPRPVLRKVQVPVLALVGAKDLQVPARENLAAIAEALKEGGNKDYTVKEMPGLNHLFQTAKTGSLTEYGQIEETFAPSALETIADWILERTKQAKAR